MPPAPVEVVAPSRLHFGLFSFGHSAGRQYGGVGVMVDRPGVRLRIASADRFAVHGPSRQRVERIVERLAIHWSGGELPPVRIEVLEAAAEHVGLGTGTQLALAVTAGLNALRGNRPLDARTLVSLAGRGGRSAIGTYGFLRGGFLIESGKHPGESLAPLEHRAVLPDCWRFVLVCLDGEQGLSGESELAAFRDLPPVPLATAEALRREATDEMVPAAARGDFARFSHSVYRFGYQAGLCFSARQGGPFAGPRVAALVEMMRGMGIEGVGQSSWGPTVFALLEDDESASQFADTLRGRLDPADTVTVARPNASGARINRIT